MKEEAKVEAEVSQPIWLRINELLAARDQTISKIKEIKSTLNAHIFDKMGIEKALIEILVKAEKFHCLKINFTSLNYDLRDDRF